MTSAEDLKHQRLFEDIELSELQSLVPVIEEIELKEGDTLFTEGEDTRGIYLIRSGRVEISKVTADGWKQRLAVFAQGHFIGELSIMEKTVHEASAKALEGSELLLLPKEEFWKLEKENVALAFQIVKKIAIIMSKNLRHMNRRFIDALINY
ncbi:MAG: cyclic nucleotide-binding domain-containing protein [Nitrospirota bacterium]|jgi:CRP/FNR family cyclic AMP-dependent transcriptional regulator